LDKATAAASRATTDAQDWVRTTMAALDQEHAAAAALKREAATTRACAASPLLDGGGSVDDATSDVDAAASFEAASIANLHAQVVVFQNTRSLVPVVHNLLSPHYNRWRNLVLLTSCKKKPLSCLL
jgi:hypothetical protein